MDWTRARASAVVEFTFIAPILMLFFLGLVGLGVEVWAQLGLIAVAQEAAHAAAVAPTASIALDQGIARGYEVGSGYRLANGSLRVSVDTTEFGPGGRVSTCRWHSSTLKSSRSTAAFHVLRDRRHERDGLCGTAAIYAGTARFER